MKVEINAYQNCPLSMTVTVDEEVITVNFGNWHEGASGNTILREGCAFINPRYEEIAQELGGEPYTRFGEPVVMTGDGSFSDYPLYQFNTEKLASLDPKGFESYMDGYKEHLPIVVEELDRIWETQIFG